MSRLISLLILCVGMSMHANAQTFTERVQKKQEGKGSVIIRQSQEIDDLVNDPTATGVQTSSQPPKVNSQPPLATPQQPRANEKEPTTETEQPVTTVTRKVTGYRVQAFAGGNSRKDRQTAEHIRNKIKAEFPNISVYVHFYSPRWICRVGNFRTYEEAHQMMVRLQNMGYKQATVVKGKINVAY